MRTVVAPELWVTIMGDLADVSIRCGSVIEFRDVNLAVNGHQLVSGLISA